MIFIDTSVLVAAALGTEQKSAKAKEALDRVEMDEPVIDTIIATETYLVLRSKIGDHRAAEAVSKYIATLGYRTVAKTTVESALSAGPGNRFGDLVIVANARSHGARLLTLDDKQAKLFGGSAVLVQ